ncbi:A24 family peptidase [Alkalihalobacillus alcalophilus]|uniref:A24 family peptidase n=1 Tax=Alkalihalobacillus alcalophilus TaxID=1445 RepID=UPI0010A67D45
MCLYLEIYDYLLFLYLLVALYMDVRYQKLPNWLTAGAMAVGLVFHLIMNGIDGLIFSVLGLLVAGLIFLLLYVFKALGAGDVKLFAGIGALIGVVNVLNVMMYSIIYAGLIAIVLLVFTRTFLRRLVTGLFAMISSLTSKDLSHLETFKATKATRFPFMYAVVPAVITAYYYLGKF